RALAILILLLGGAPPPTPIPTPPATETATATTPTQATAQERFLGAGELLRRGDAASAATAFDRLAEAADAGEYAVDALFGAAGLPEERLGEPAGGLARYQALVRRFPSSRLARRAQRRVDFLAPALAGGAEPLAAYQDALAGLPTRPRADSAARV